MKEVKYLPAHLEDKADQLWENYLIGLEIVKQDGPPSFFEWDGVREFLEGYFPLKMVLPESYDIVLEHADKFGLKLVIEDFEPNGDHDINELFYTLKTFQVFEDYDDYLHYMLKTKGLDTDRLDNLTDALLEAYNG